MSDNSRPELTKEQTELIDVNLTLPRWLVEQFQTRVNEENAKDEEFEISMSSSIEQLIFSSLRFAQLANQQDFKDGPGFHRGGGYYIGHKNPPKYVKERAPKDKVRQTEHVNKTKHLENIPGFKKT